MAMGAIFVTPALADNQTVTVDPGEFFSPARVAIKPNESVTWKHSGGIETHNVRFEDDQFTRPSPATGDPYSVTRSSFPTAGVYRYYCETHGSPGGVGMSGVVYVNATGELPPEARFTVSPNPAVAGQVVTFDATSSTPAAGSIVKYEWDLNGDGMFELDTGTTPTTSKTYMSPPVGKVGLKVTDSRLDDIRTQTLTIDPASTPTPDPTPNPQPDPAPQPQPTPQPGTAPQPGAAPQPQSNPKPGATTHTADPGTSSPRAFSFLTAATSSRVKGVAVSVKCAGRCKFSAALSISASVARKARLGRKATTIGSARGTLSAAGTKRVTVKVTAKARRRLARLKSVSATLKLAVVDASGATSRKQKSVKLRR